MPNRTTDRLTAEQVVTNMTNQMDRLARTLSTWVQDAPHTLQELEEHVVRLTHEVGSALLSGLCHLAAQHPEPDVPCPCGYQARYVRMRPATVTTVLGAISYQRA